MGQQKCIVIISCVSFTLWFWGNWKTLLLLQAPRVHQEENTLHYKEEYCTTKKREASPPPQLTASFSRDRRCPSTAPKYNPKIPKSYDGHPYKLCFPIF